MGELGEVPNQLQSFRVQDAKCYCCNHSHIHPHSGESLPCDRQLVYETFKKWWSAGAEEGSEQHLERFNTLVRQRVAPKVARGLGIALPFHYVVYMAVFCMVPWLSDFIALWAETRDHRAAVSMWSLRHFIAWGIVGVALLFALRMCVWLWKLGSRIEKRLDSRWCAVFIVAPLSFFGVCALWLPIGISLAATPEDNPLPVFLFIAAIAITALVWRAPKWQEPLPSKQPSPHVFQRKEDNATFSI
ncbi:unnamed protein product [Symbiodinium pilosum]|uniref:Uncharacterized protein n=1 Tax=Symbiodinium pilosum TaxID=2952 RepID=A0A812SPU0_SYMPI|nr:unnamed protein product [Symbiodinium pilosum]